jgi:hypothetical protein
VRYKPQLGGFILALSLGRLLSLLWLKYFERLEKGMTSEGPDPTHAANHLGNSPMTAAETSREACIAKEQH